MRFAKGIPAVLMACTAGAAGAASQPVAATAGSFFQVLIGLAVVLGLMAAAAWSLKRFNLAKFAGNAPIKIVGGVSVGNRERILVVEVAGQWIVVGVAAGQVSALSTMPRPHDVEPAGTPSEPKNFSGWLKQMIDKRNAQ